MLPPQDSDDYRNASEPIGLDSPIILSAHDILTMPM
jgi:hypothetical protein